MATATRHTIEVFSAGCPACDDGIKTVREVAGSAHTVKIHDMQADKGAQARAKQLGIHRVPAVVVNGQVAQCCHQEVVDGAVIRSLVAKNA